MVKKNIKKKEKISVYSIFKSSLEHLIKIRMYVFVAIILFLIGGFFGYSDIIGIFSKEASQSINQQVLDSVNDIIKQTEGLGPVELTGFIMFNNIKTAFFGLVFGIFFGIIPIAIIILNGYVLGFVSNLAVSFQGIQSLWRLFPHGIFEIPAILISIGIGIRIGAFPFYIKNKTRGILGILLSFICFSFLLMIFLFFLSLATNQSSSTLSENVLDNPAVSFVFIILAAFSFAVSVLLGAWILTYSDRKIVFEEIKNSAKVFVFVIIPLLIIAGIIEGLLITALG